MEILCTYVRENALSVKEESRSNPTSVARKKSSEEPASSQGQHPPADIQAILTVLARRDRAYERSDQYLDLSRTTLTGADLHGAHLERADLGEAVLSKAYLRGADLRGTDLHAALLSSAYLVEAELSGADLVSANLSGADLREANLSGADISRALYLTQEQVNHAYGNDDTQLPLNLCLPRSWQGVTAKTPGACPAP